MDKDEFERELADLLHRAGKGESDLTVVLLPRSPAEAMGDLLRRLKDVWGIPQEENITTINVDGQDHIASGVERDL